MGDGSMKDKITEVVEFRLRLTLAERMQLELMAVANGFASHHQLARSIIQSVLEDDRRAHEDSASLNESTMGL